MKLPITSNSVTDSVKLEIKRCYKNLAAVCIGWFLLVLSFGSLQGIASSINHEEGIGFFSMACFYAGAIVCPFAAAVLRRWNTKPVLCMLTLAQIPLVLSYALPKLYTVLPAAFIGGIAQSVAFSLTGSYLVWVAGGLSDANGDKTSKYLSMAFGIYYMAVSFAPTIGGICSTFILSINVDDSIHLVYNESIQLNYMLKPNESITNTSRTCGPDFCPFTKTDVSQLEIPDIIRYSLLGFYCLCMVAATLVFSIGMQEKSSKLADEQFVVLKVLKSTINVIRKPRFLIVAPLVFYNGFQWAFAVGDIMKAFGGCVYGAQNVGNFVASYHFATCISSVLAGFVEPKTGRKALFLFACSAHIATCIIMMYWSSYPSYLAYAICALWGLGSGTLLSQSHSLMGQLFPKKVEAAMAVYLMFRSFGHILGFGYAHFLCMHTKIYVTGSVCLIATGFFTLCNKFGTRQKDVVIVSAGKPNTNDP